MKKLTAIIAVALLLVAAALVWWGKGRAGDSTSADGSPGSEERARPTRRQQDRSPKESKWQALTDDSIPTKTRLDLARSIDTDIPSAEIDLLLAAFTHTTPSHAPEQWYLVLNEIMEQMRKKGVAADRLGPALTALVVDPTQLEVVRDYAIQHLSQWIAPPSVDTPCEKSPQHISTALQAIAATVTDPSIAHTSIPGTALMALTANNEYLPEELTAPIWQKLDPTLSAILSGETQASLATRTTVIQSTALRGSSTHLPIIRTFAHDEDADPSLRLSSIAALGIYRSESDRSYLQSIATGSTRYRYAAQSALKKFSN